MAADIRIELDQERVRRINAILLGSPKKAKSVFYHAIKRGVSKTNTEAKKQIKKRYAIDESVLSGYKTVTQRTYSSDDGVTGEIDFAGTKIGLYKFKPSPAARKYLDVAVHPSGWGWRRTGPVKAMEYKAKGYHATKGFIATMPNGHTGIWKRISKTTPPPDGKSKIKEEWGPSVADMLDYDQAREEIIKETSETVNKRLDHELYRMLNGF